VSTEAKFDANGRLTDEITRQKITELIENLVSFRRRMKGM
jgi:hypothetical protein